MIERTQYTVTEWGGQIGTGEYQPGKFRLAISETEANCYGSKISAGEMELHAPTIDIDFPCRLVKSTSTGHSHLYIDKALTWEDYVKLLRVMVEVGLVEKAFFDFSIKKGQTMLRKPGITKNLKYDPPENPIHLVRLKEITAALNGLVKGMEPEPEVKPTEKLPFQL